MITIRYVRRVFVEVVAVTHRGAPCFGVVARYGGDPIASPLLIARSAAVSVARDWTRKLRARWPGIPFTLCGFTE